jgi:hypothetical protein
MKVCNKCNLEKDIVHFKPCKKNKDNISNRCRMCISEYEREKYRLSKIANGGRNPKNLLCREIKRKLLESSYVIGFECDEIKPNTQ